MGLDPRYFARYQVHGCHASLFSQGLSFREWLILPGSLALFKWYDLVWTIMLSSSIVFPCQSSGSGHCWLLRTTLEWAWCAACSSTSWVQCFQKCTRKGNSWIMGQFHFKLREKTSHCFSAAAASLIFWARSTFHSYSPPALAPLCFDNSFPNRREDVLIMVS